MLDSINLREASRPVHLGHEFLALLLQNEPRAVDCEALLTMSIKYYDTVDNCFFDDKTTAYII